jgi:hypothetical protein
VALLHSPHVCPLGGLISARGGEVSPVELGLLERSMDRAGKLLIAAAALDLDGRMQKLRGDQIEMLLEVTKIIVVELGHNPDDDDVRLARAKAFRILAEPSQAR